MTFMFFLTLNIAYAEDAACVEDWVCTAWTECLGNNQTRACNDLNFCGTAVDKPEELKSCASAEKPKTPAVQQSKSGVAVCEEKWKCTMWSSCAGGKQTRDCFDENLCNTLKEKPAGEQRCTQSSTPAVIPEEPQAPLGEQPSNFAYYAYILLGALIISILGFFGYSYFNTKPSIQSAYKIQPGARQRPVDNIIFDYVDKMKLAGHSNEQIRNELVKAGYSGESVNQYLPRENAELRQFSRQMMLKGYDIQQIEDHLFTYGYDQRTIAQIKEELSNFRLR